MARQGKGSPPTRSTPVFAVDLGGTKLATAVVGPRGRLGHQHEEPVDTSDARAPVEQIVRLARSTEDSVAAIGVAVPGLVRRDGNVWAPNLPGWDAMPLANELRRRLRIPVAVESDRNAVVLGESWRGAARGRDDVIVLIVGTGIGAGILSGGRLLRGAHELSGCAGWMVVNDQRNETASRIGSLESLAAGPAVARAAGRRFANAAAVADAARKGDEKARKVFERTGELLGRAIGNLVSLFDPEIIVLTGGITSAADLFIDQLRRTALTYGQPLSTSAVEVVVSDLGTRANLFGAARIAFDAAAGEAKRRSRG